ncbi:hypothetical protein ARMSODRAFT_1023340 [Armillaria solidipes]|uniref:Uncharacterized protein n=1 Tax=Armillaria solidipes TaxID=1076256 RepID=A0A2H3B3A1_9AGAR|nr:hypothetical protein ARMSODRAFT_1023340 [Armillaria solidipes]
MLSFTSARNQPCHRIHLQSLQTNALVSGTGAAVSATPILTNTAPPPPGNAELLEDELNLVESSLRSMRRRLKRDLSHRNMLPLPPVTGQGAFLGARPLSPIHEEAPVLTTPPPLLPVEEWLSIIVEQSPPPVDAPPSPPWAYHPMTGAPLHSRSLVIMSLAPDEPSPPAPAPSQAPSRHGTQGQAKGKKSKDKGKGKATAPAPASARSPLRSATAKAACIPDALTDAESAKAGPLVKKSRFSHEKAVTSKLSKPPVTIAADPAPQDSNRMFHGHPKQQFLAVELTQAQDPEVAGIPIDRHNSHPELENYHFEDLVTVPDEFFDPVCYGHKNGTYGACSSHYAFYAHAPDHYEKEGHHGGCSAHYTAHEMHKITSRLTTFARYNIPSLHRNIMQLHGINHELEHVDYLYRSRVRARDHVVHNIAETLDRFASAEGGNELIKALSGAYCEVRSFIIDDGLQRSVGQPLNLPQGPKYVPSDNNTSMWNEGEDDAGEDDGGQAAGPSGTQGGDDSGAAGSSK